MHWEEKGRVDMLEKDSLRTEDTPRACNSRQLLWAVTSELQEARSSPVPLEPLHSLPLLSQSWHFLTRP